MTDEEIRLLTWHRLATSGWIAIDFIALLLFLAGYIIPRPMEASDQRIASMIISVLGMIGFGIGTFAMILDLLKTFVAPELYVIEKKKELRG